MVNSTIGTETKTQIYPLESWDCHLNAANRSRARWVRRTLVTKVMSNEVRTAKQGGLSVAKSIGGEIENP